MFSAVGFLHGKLYILKDSDDVFNFDFFLFACLIHGTGGEFVYVFVCWCVYVCPHYILHFVHTVCFLVSLHPSHVLTT